jgi:hypothetical protein
MITVLGNLAPKISDKVMGKVMPYLQRTDKPLPGARRGALYEPVEDLHERGGYAMTFEHDLYSSAQVYFRPRYCRTGRLARSGPAAQFQPGMNRRR